MKTKDLLEKDVPLKLECELRYYIRVNGEEEMFFVKTEGLALPSDLAEGLTASVYTESLQKYVEDLAEGEKGDGT